MDGTRSYSLVISAAESIKGLTKEALPFLGIGCKSKERKPRVFITAGEVVDASMDRYGRWSISSRTKFDDGEPKFDYWSVTDDLTMLFSMSPDPKLVKRIAASSVLRVEVRFHSEGVQVMRFDIHDLRARLPWLADRCGWKM